MTTRRAAIVDENLVNQGEGRLGAIKKTTVTTTSAATTTRPALGNLVNRTDKARGLNTKKAAVQNGSENVTGSSAGAVDLKKVKPRVDTHWKVQPASKPLPRNNLAINNSGPKLVKTKTVETATLKEAKLIDKSERPAVKRQDSTLTRRKVVATTAKVTEATKKTVVPAKSKSNSESSDSGVVPENPVIESRFRPPCFGVSYSTGFINNFDGLNIDDGDDDNALLVSEYVNDIYSYLFHLEEQYAIRKNHLSEQIEVAPKMRTVLLDWISEVHTQYHFAQETFHIAAATIDRYLQTVKSTSRKNLQLVGVSALFIASKYEELYPPEVKDFVYLADNAYTKDEILAMEKHILKKLKFEMGAPTPIHFLRRLSKAAQSDGKTHVFSKYFIELSVIDYNLSEYLPSEIAAASLFLSLCLVHSLTKDQNVNYASLWTPILEFYSTYNLAHLRPIVTDLVEYVSIAHKSKQNNVYLKYSSPKFGETAVVVQKSVQILQKVIEAEW